MAAVVSRTLRAALADGREHFQRGPWVLTLTGLVVTVALLGLNLLGDGLRDLFDPRLRRAGGQLQRAAIARALSLEPDLIVADEAVSKLDVSVRAQSLNLVRRIHAARGISMLFVPHDLEVARFLCHRIGVVRAGTLLEIGPTRQLFAAPKHEYTRQSLATVQHGAETHA